VSGVFVLGAGGHAKVVVSTLQALNSEITAVLDDDVSRFGQQILGVPIVGSLDSLPPSARAVAAIGDNRVRRTTVERFPQVEWVTAIHPFAYVHPSVGIGVGTVVFAGAVIQPDVVVGEHVIVNTCASVDHDCQIKSYVHISPGCHLAGNVQIDEGGWMGLGSSAIPGSVVGEWAVVGAGGVVVRNVPSHRTSIGIPARPLPN
jgi:sugar O-acyltransferase (sialic acid O-acetyltransferase NeuD family)